MGIVRSTSVSTLENVSCVSVIGLGKLGSPMVACFASKGFRVIGVDVNPEFVAKINAGEAPVFEPGLSERLHDFRSRISGTENYSAAISESQASFIIVPTPSQADGWFSNGYVIDACKCIGEVLKNKSAYHLVVITSTVMPGATDGIIRQTLEQASGKKVGSDFGLCYSPEFIALGSVIRDFLKPDFVLLGESDSRAGDLLSSIYQKVCENNPPIARMSLVNAELTKISVNTYVTMKITFANILARICERLPAADADVVASAMGKDTRIGTKYLKGSLGYGGPCFPRDNLAFSRLARSLGAPAVLAESTDTLNRAQVREISEIVERRLPRGAKIGILGLSYKPNTDVVEESQGLELARALSASGFDVQAFDPAAGARAEQALAGSRVRIAGSMSECCDGVQGLLITTPWPEFSRLPWERLNGKTGLILDCWRILDPEIVQAEARCEYLTLGRYLGQESVRQERVPL